MAATVRSIGATVRNISPASGSTPLGGLCGYGDHQVPDGYIIVELKLCENCGTSFMRKKYEGIKYCGPCRSASLMPPKQEEYREMLPKEAEMKHRTHLPHYDDSLLPKGPKGPKVDRRRRENKRSYSIKIEKLRGAFLQKPIMTAEEIQDIVDKPGAPHYVVSILKQNKSLGLITVGELDHEPGMGRGLRLYSLKSIIEVATKEEPTSIQ